MASKGLQSGIGTLFRNNYITHLRLYSKWVHRRPSKIINSDINDDFDQMKKVQIENQLLKSEPYIAKDALIEDLNTIIVDETLKNDKTYSTSKIHSDNTSKSLHKQLEDGLFINIRAEQVQKKTREEKSKVVCDKLKISAQKLGVPVFTKLKEDDPKISNAMLLTKSRNKRQKKDFILLEGKHLLKDAIEAGVVPHMLFFSRVSDIKDLPIPDHGVELYKLPYKTLALWSDLSTCPGIIGIVKTPPVHEKKPEIHSLPLTVICDSVSDPGNLGSILRAAAGVGCQKIILTKGCVDLWLPKVLRTGAGSHFRVPIHKDVSWNSVDQYLDINCSVYLADNISVDVERNYKEENGGSKYSTERTRYFHGKKEKQSGQNSLGKDVSTVENEDQQNISLLPVLPYYAVDFQKQTSLALVIGGENEGLSVDAFKLAYERSGVILNIPLCNCVESLNTGTALGIVIFEMKRQCLRKPTDLYVNSEEDENEISNENFPLSNV